MIELLVELGGANMLMRWLMMTSALWIAESLRYWGASANADTSGLLVIWGIVGTLSGATLGLGTLLGYITSRSWPQLSSMSISEKTIVLGSIGVGVVGVIASARWGVEWSGARFRRPLYRGLFTGLVTATIATLSLMIIPAGARWVLERWDQVTRRYQRRSTTKSASPPLFTQASSSAHSVFIRACLLRLAWGVVTLWCCLELDTLAVALVEPLVTVDLRAAELVLIGGWGALIAAPLIGHRFNNPRILALLSALSLLALSAGLYIGDHATPERAISLKRDSALTSPLIGLAQRLTDGDGDGISARWGGGDCDDTDRAHHPDAVERGRQARNCNRYQSPRNQPHWPRSTPSPVIVPTGPPEDAFRVARAPRNLILLTIDALRYDAYREHMPMTQAFAARSVDFSAAYSAGAATYWSIPALLGSRPPSYFHMGRDQTPTPQERLLTEIVRERGFHTALFANVTIFFARGLSQGAITKNYNTSRHTVHGARPGAAHLTDGMIKHIDAWRAKRLRPQRDRFFLWGHYYDPHDPYFEVPDFPALSDKPRDRYAAIVRSVDAEIGRLIHALETRDLLSDTMIVLTADHGDEFGEHGSRFHGRTLYEEMVHVPLIVYSPSYPARSVDAVISHLDVAPTLLSHLGLKPEPRFLGSDWDHALRRGRTLDYREAFFEVLPDSNYGVHLVGMRRRDEKLIYHAQSGALERYQLRTDPRERLNLTLSDPDPSVTREEQKRPSERALMNYYEAHLRELARRRSGARYPRLRK